MTLGQSDRSGYAGYSVIDWDDSRGDVGWAVVDQQGPVCGGTGDRS